MNMVVPHAGEELILLKKIQKNILLAKLEHFQQQALPFVKNALPGHFPQMVQAFVYLALLGHTRTKKDKENVLNVKLANIPHQEQHNVSIAQQELFPL